MKKIATILLTVSGVINILFLLFHIMFYSLFKWNENLNCLTNSDRSILLTFNLIGILIIGAMAYFQLFFKKELLHSKLGLAILIMFAMFYSIRVFTEFYHFGFSMPQSIVILFMCSIPVFCNVYGIVFNIKSKVLMQNK